MQFRSKTHLGDVFEQRMKRTLALRRSNEDLNTLNGIFHLRSSRHRYKLLFRLGPTVVLTYIWFFGGCLNMLREYLEGVEDTEAPNKYALILLQVLTNTRMRAKLILDSFTLAYGRATHPPARTLV